MSYASVKTPYDILIIYDRYVYRNTLGIFFAVRITAIQ